MGRRTAYLHVGLPRSGCGFLESALAEHAEALAEVGIRHPAVSPEEMLRAAVEIRRDHHAWGYQRREVEGTWAEICRRARKGRSDVILSHELLAGCTPDQIDLLLDALSGFEVHAVITSRDPDSQLATAAGGEDLGEVAARWARALRSAARVHVLVVPPHAEAASAVWLSLGELVGFDATRLPLPAPGSSTDPADEQLLELAERWRKKLADGGYDVRGDTADLLPHSGEAMPLADRLAITTEALAAASTEVARLRRQAHRLEKRNEKVESKRRKLKRKLAKAV